MLTYHFINCSKLKKSVCTQNSLFFKKIRGFSSFEANNIYRRTTECSPTRPSHENSSQRNIKSLFFEKECPEITHQDSLLSRNHSTNRLVDFSGNIEKDLFLKKTKERCLLFREEFGKIRSNSQDPSLSTHLLPLLRKCIEFRDTESSFQAYLLCKTEVPQLLTNEDYSNLISLFSISIKARSMANNFISNFLDRYNHRESVPGYASMYLKKVFCDLALLPNYRLEEKDWDSLFVGLSKDLDIESIEILWWILIARNEPKVLASFKLQLPPKNTVLKVTGNEKLFHPVKITTAMANAVLHCRSRTRLVSRSFINDRHAVTNATSIVDHMTKMKVPRNELTYLELFSAFHHHYRYDDYFFNAALKLLQYLERPHSQTELTIGHYNYLITCLYQRKRYLAIRRLFRKICNNPSVKVNINTLNLMLSTYIKSPGSIVIYDFFYKQSKKWNLKPVVGTLNILIEAQVQFGETEGIESLLKEFEMVGVYPDHIGYTHIIRGFVSMGNIKEAEIALKQYMHREDLVLKPDPFHHLMREYAARGNSVSFWDAFSVLELAKLRIPLKIWSTILRFSEKFPSECLRLFLISIQANQLGRCDFQLLGIVVQSCCEADSGLESLVESLVQRITDKQELKRAAKRVSDVYYRTTGKELPLHIIQKFEYEDQTEPEDSVSASNVC